MFINLFEAWEVSYMLVFFIALHARYAIWKFLAGFNYFLLLTGQLVAARLGNFVYFDVATL